MYELTYIISPLGGGMDLNATIERIRHFIIGLGGEIKNELTHGKKKLSYPIKKQTAGYYVTTEFNLGEEKMPELQRELKTIDDVLRFILLSKDERKTTAAKIRPRKILAAAGRKAVKAQPERPPKEEKVKIEELDKKLDEILEG